MTIVLISRNNKREEILRYYAKQRDEIVSGVNATS